jgi:hypothetical protein
LKKNRLIELPYLYDLSFKDQNGLPVLVNEESPPSLPKAVEKLAIYCRYELHIDFPQYTARTDVTHPDVSAWLWTDYDWEGVFAVGGCSFRRDILEWVWIHPYYRGRGLLKKAWPVFIDLYGNFAIEPPLSHAMQGFVKKVVDGL